MEESVSTHDRNQALYAHVSGLLALTGLPFAHVIGPLVFYLQAKNTTSTFALENAREALNFQITAGIVWTIAIVAYIVAIFSTLASVPAHASAMPPAGFFASMGVALAFVLVALLYALFDFICVILAAVAVSNGKSYRYPLSIRFVR
jgi:uncharacterized Tic20 family protein